MRPQRCAVTTRLSPSSTTTMTICVGATLKRPPGKSTSGSAPNSAAISSLDRYWVIRPHIDPSDGCRLRTSDWRFPAARCEGAKSRLAGQEPGENEGRGHQDHLRANRHLHAVGVGKRTGDRDPDRAGHEADSEDEARGDAGPSAHQ